MKFLLNQDVYALTAQFLRENGHDVITASDLNLSRAKDADLLKIAAEQKRIFVTRDRDYGNLVFVHGAGNGVIYLRMLPSTLTDVHRERKNVLNNYDETELERLFVVVEQNRHRIRRIE
jgi:predicted nuclease of predicted toxin-antitoxin system